MKGQNFASQVLSRHTFRISRKKGSDFFDHRGTLIRFFVRPTSEQYLALTYVSFCPDAEVRRKILN